MITYKKQSITWLIMSESKVGNTANDVNIVEPNKMMPNYGSQKVTFLSNCICEKGRYFVPMVRCIYICAYFSFMSILEIAILSLILIYN